mmetsp:Transcript_67541/g.154893  ORF Transcript_67541/g.154893 Transcript_67541/m.154893 type:complete len:142 (+) Transcript_67541:172-597(+)
MRHLVTLLDIMFPETAKVPKLPNTIPLAEAAVFYQTKCSEDWCTLAKHVIKDFMELRLLFGEVETKRLRPEFLHNDDLVRILKHFHVSVVDAREALDFAATLPEILYTKTDKWMTREQLEPEVREILATLHSTPLPPVNAS